jgi:hypothetical protein
VSDSFQAVTDRLGAFIGAVFAERGAALVQADPPAEAPARTMAALDALVAVVDEGLSVCGARRDQPPERTGQRH